MDKQTESRKAFELWAKSEGMDVTRGIAKGYISTRYIDADTYLAWEWWQKSRDSLVVELPKPTCTYADHSYPAYSQKQVEKMLVDCGIRIKGEGV